MNNIKCFSQAAFRVAIVAAALPCISGLVSSAADVSTNKPGKSSLVGLDLFPPKILAKGRNVEVKSSQLDEAYLAFKANRAAAGQPVSEAARPQIERQILDKLIATQLFLSRAIAKDREAGKGIADKFIAEARTKASSEASFQRQLLAEGTTVEAFEAQVLEQAVVKAVIDREIRDKITIKDEDLKKFFDENSAKLGKPERLRVSHILFGVKDAAGAPLPPEQIREKQDLATRVLGKARGGDDFVRLVLDFSEDRNSNRKSGEYTFARGQLPHEFDAAAWSLKPNQISDLVTTAYGFHIIKCLERFPEEKAEFPKVRDQIRETLLQEEVQKRLPGHIEQLKKEAAVEILP